MTLKDGTQMNYGVIRIAQNFNKMIFYTEKGLQEMFKSDMNEEQKANAEQLKKLDEKTLIKLGYVSEMPLTNIQVMN